MNKKKIKKIITLLVSIIAIVGIGSLIAFLTDTDTETNVFTMGKVDIELLEPNWNESNGEDILPGQPIQKDPKIKNIGNNPAYVYMKIVNPIVNLTNGEGPLFSYTINTGWTKLDEVEQCGYKATTYYYNTSLNPNASTPTLFDSVTINDFSGEIATAQSLDVYAYGIQSTYLQSGSTVQSLFTSTFTTSLSDTDKSCNSVTDCNNKELFTTVSPKLKGLAKIMAQNALLDNGQSEYVSSCSGVSFSDISSDTNGKGIYEIASTKNNTYPIYYYRGAVDNNNVIFGGFCWKAMRTTDTGGVKLIYNGSPDGSGNCTNTTGEATQMGKSVFNSRHNSIADVGFMYGTIYPSSTKQANELVNGFIYGNDVSYSNGMYTLQDTITGSSSYNAYYSKLNNYHYTCFSTTNSCSTVYFIYYISQQGTGTGAYNYVQYITLTNGKNGEDALDEALTNITDSSVKIMLDNWYNTNLSSYANYIEDTIYCNDRSIYDLGSWDPDRGITRISGQLEFSPRNRAQSIYTPTLECSRNLDKFTVSSAKGNGKLTYPVGLITIDEAMYAGGKFNTANSAYYLYTNQYYWSISAQTSSNNNYYEMCISSEGRIVNGDVNASYDNYGLRPVISLKATDIVESGDGTSTNPYVIKSS